ncbi:BolA family protein [Palleronia caenipelagi]|uniref:BolA family transcriptional regulator n=1 Tax=Palleronia caenipelagi TaxID=2489174 RepID=A0A547QAV9_9RHOB|nr:BolA family protein [Palleronia caenipelagi]TRD23531.1 BolA family transcriptional regulator [Palleronia caenipelagi]
MSVADKIKSRLDAAFQPTELDVEDQSAMHAGHAGAPAEGESHFAVRIRGGGLGDLSRIARHRAVHDAIGKELMARIHALSIDAG